MLQVLTQRKATKLQPKNNNKHKLAVDFAGMMQAKGTNVFPFCDGTEMVMIETKYEGEYLLFNLKHGRAMMAKRSKENVQGLALRYYNRYITPGTLEEHSSVSAGELIDNFDEVVKRLRMEKLEYDGPCWTVAETPDEAPHNIHALFGVKMAFEKYEAALALREQYNPAEGEYYAREAV